MGSSRENPKSSMVDETTNSRQPLGGWPFLLPAVWLGLLPLLPSQLLAFSPTIDFWEGLGWLTGLAAMTVLAFWRGWLTAFSLPFAVGVIFFLWLTARTGIAGSHVSRLALLGLIVFVLGATLHRAHLRHYFRVHLTVLWFVLAFAGLESLGILSDKFLAFWRYRDFEFGSVTRLSGPFFHPNLFAFYLFLSLVVILWAYHARRRLRRPATALLIQASLCTFFISLTFSRGVLLGAAMMAVVMLILPKNLAVIRKGVVLRVAAACVIGGLVGALITAGAWSARIAQVGAMADQAMAPTESHQIDEDVAVPTTPMTAEQLDVIGRRDIWQEALSFHATSPLAGIGMGEFLRRGRGFYHAHNVVLELLLAGGLISLLLIAVVIGASWKERNQLTIWHLLLATLLFAGVFDCFLFFRLPFLVFSLCVGMLCRPPASDEPGSWRVPSAGWINEHSWIHLRRHAIVLACLFLAVGAARITHQVVNTSYPIDSFTYYSSVRYTLATGDAPYVAWPSGLRLPEELPMTEWCMENVGGIPFRFFYPPSAILLLSPFAMIPSPPAAIVAYFLFQLLLVGLIIYGATILAGGRHLLWINTLLVFAFAETQIDMLVGNVSLIMACLALWAWIFHKQGRSTLAGALIAVAAAIKVFPVVWLLLLIAKPRGAIRLVGGFLLVASLVFGASIAAFGYEFWVQYKFWVIDALNTYPPSGPNSSIFGLLSPYNNPAAPQMRLVILGILGMGLLVTAFYSRGRLADQLALAVLAFSVLATPVAWSHYHLIPLGLLCAQIAPHITRPNEQRGYHYLIPFVCLSLGYIPPANWIVTYFGGAGLVLITVLPIAYTIRAIRSENRKGEVVTDPHLSHPSTTKQVPT